MIIDDQKIENLVLRVNTEKLNRVFPFVVTCGTELTEWADCSTDMLEIFFADEIKMAALGIAMAQLEKDIEARFNTGVLSQMNPGSLEDWSIYEQKKLFALLGGGVSRVGVDLLNSMVMYPDKSESGIFFEKEKRFSNCQLCPVARCLSRRGALPVC